MKLTFIFVVAAFLQAKANINAQTVVLHVKNEKIEKVFKEIQKQTGYVIVYNSRFENMAKPVTVNADKSNLVEVLRQCFENQPFTYEIQDKIIVLKDKPTAKPATATSSVELPLLQPLPPTVKGRITNENGDAVAGVTITVKGGKVLGISDAKGEFVLNNIANDATLVFTSVNMKTLEVKLNGRTELALSMTSKVNQLEDVVMIGYGTTTKRKNTGSVSTVTAEEIAKQPVQNPLNALQGHVAGAVVTQSNGLPGSRVNILIRGNSSLGNGTVPLYIIDGVPFNINDQAVPATNDLNSFGFFAANGGISPFSMINASDIERIDVLKDADATAIYGTKAANGVVLITTKKAKAGKTKMDINVYQGIGQVAHYIDMLNLPQYLSLRHKAFNNDGIVASAANAPDFFIYDSTSYTDWQRKYLGGSAMNTDAQVSVSGGDVRTRFLLGAGYHRETTVFPGNQNDQRLSARFSAEHNSLDRKFLASISANYSFDESNLIGTDLASYYNTAPDYKLYNADGTLFWDANYTNPEARLFQKYKGKTNNLVSNTQLRYTILPGLDIKTNFGFTKVSLNQNQQTPAISANPTSSPTNNARFSYVDQQSYIFEPQATYTRKISKGVLNLLAGATWQRSLNTTTVITATNYSNPNLLASISGAASYSPSGTYTLYKYNSFFGRLNYSWKEKYILNANIRRDGSSRFGPGDRFGTFGSVGGAWVFTNEAFGQKILPFLSFGKLRASYGITGNDQFQDYQFLSTYSAGSPTFAYQGTSILSPSIYGNPNLHWETNKKMEFGLDLSMLKDRISLTVNYYRNRSDNQLSYISISSQSGFNSFTGNFPALLQNKGFEFELNTKNIETKNFSWKTSFNLTLPNNKLLSVAPNYYYASSYLIGYSYNQVQRFTYKGVDPATGKPLYKDATKDSLTFTPNFSTDRSLIGNSDPKWFGGISNEFQYKNWSFSFFIQGTSREANIYPTGTPGVLGNVPSYWLSAGMWQNPGDIASAPKATTTTSVYSNLSSSNFPWGDNSFIKLRNISLSYNLPSGLLKRLNMSGLRVYAQAQNVMTWTKNKIAYDPETGTSTPPLRVITFGLNCSF